MLAWMSKALLSVAFATVLSAGVSSRPAIAQTLDYLPGPRPPTEDRRTPPARETQPSELQADPAEPVPEQQPPGPGPVTRTGFHAYVYSVAHDFGAMPTMKSTYAVLGGAGLLAAAVHNQDTKINSHFQGGSSKLFSAGKYLGQSYTIAAAAFATYMAGRVAKNDKASHIGIDELRALLESELLVQGLKYTIRRERPEGTGYSFPSGHATDSFAAATVLARHFGAKAAIPTYTVASYIAMSRLHENRHYASDVIFGAGLGYVVGHTVTRHGKGNFTEFAMYPMAVPGGAGIGFVRTQH
jgi:hypothetical protein